MSKVKFAEVDYGYFGKCLKIENELAEMLVTIEKGPRIISFKASGAENIMCEDIAENSTMEGGLFAQTFGDKKWFIYGGHRLWFSPEHNPKSYYPDNDPVKYEIVGNKVTLTPPPQTETGLQFVMEITFFEDKAGAEIVHKITNISSEAVKISPWAMTVVDRESVAILPQCTKDTGLLSNRNLTIWPYTDMLDDRLFIANRFITVKQDSACKCNLKVGFNNDRGWLAMLNKNQLFVKKFPYIENAEYPDNNCSCECFTNFFMMEIESLGVLKTLAPQETTVHPESWFISQCADSFDRRNESSVAEFVAKNIDETKIY